MKVLVTGITGNLGKSLEVRLKTLGHEILGISRKPLNKDFAVLEADILDSDKIQDFIAKEKPDAIIHLAAHLNSNDPQIYTINYEATLSIAETAANLGVSKFIFASSGAVYGDKGKAPYEETASLLGSSVYSKTKILAEKALVGLAKKTNMQVINARIFNIYGPGFNDSLINKLLSSNETTLYSSPNFIRDYIHVDRVTEVLEKLLKVEENHYINVGNGVGWDNNKLLEFLKAKGINPRVNMSMEDIYSYSIASITKLKELIGFTADESIQAS